MNTATLTLPKLNDRVIAIHPKTGKKVQVVVTKVFKKSFHGINEKTGIFSSFTKWEPLKTEPKPDKSTPAKFKAGDRIRIVSTGINGWAQIIEKQLDDPQHSEIYRVILDGKSQSELFAQTEKDEIILDFKEGDRVLMLTKELKGKTGSIIKKTEEDKESRFFNKLYRIKLDGEEISHLYSKDEFEFSIKPVEPSETTEATSIAQKQIDFLSFENADSIDTSELKKDELLARAISEHHAIAKIEKEEAKLALFKLNHARKAGDYFRAFKKRCQHGEFESSVQELGVSNRTAQTYMQIASFWGVIEGKAQSSALLEECQVLSISWALNVIRDEKKSLKSAEPNPELPLFNLPTNQPTDNQPTEPPPITEGSNVEITEEGFFNGKIGVITGFTQQGNKAVVRFNSNNGHSHSGLIDLKNLKQTDFNSITEELDEKAKNLGLTNGLPDLRDRDRSVAEKLDPTTVNDQPGYYPVEIVYPPVETVENHDEIDERLKNLSPEVVKLVKYNAIGEVITDFGVKYAIDTNEACQTVIKNASYFTPDLAAEASRTLIEKSDDVESVIRLVVTNLSKESLQLLKKVISEF